MSTQPYVIEQLVNKEKDDVENTPQGHIIRKSHRHTSTHLSLPASFEQFLSYSEQ